MRRLEPEAEVKAKVVAVAAVAVRLVVVAFVMVRDERESGEETVREPIVALFANKLVLVTVVPVRASVSIPAPGRRLRAQTRRAHLEARARLRGAPCDHGGGRP
jgi:hypothetical protein